MDRRTVLKTISACLIGMNFAATSHASGPTINVYKSASCGCCEAWVKHLQENGFTVIATDVDDPTVYRTKFGVPDALGACHTGIVAGYALEGHVPAADIKRLLTDKPKARGLAVPGMPLGSPGMEGPRADAYDVMLILPDGGHRVYRHVGTST